MRRISCEIIKDLLPLYEDSICSKESEELVREHLAECESCRRLSERMKTLEFRVEENASEELDYMKRMKRHIYRRESICFAGFILMLLVIMVPVAESHGSQIPIQTYYLILPIMSGIFYLIFSEHTVSNRWTGWKAGMSVTALALLAYTIALPLMAVHWMHSGNYPFGLQPERIGPFINNQFVVVSLLHVLSITAAVFGSARTGISTSLLQTAGITGCCMSSALITWLRRLDSMEASVAARNTIIAVILLEGISLAIIFRLLDKRRTGSKKSCF